MEERPSEKASLNPKVQPSDIESNVSTASKRGDVEHIQAPTSSNASLASRVGNSASSLVRDVFSSTPAGASSVTSAISSLASSDKPSGSSSFPLSGATSSGSSAWTESGSLRASSHATRANGGLGAGFRETPQLQSDGSEFVSFEEMRLSDQLEPMSQKSQHPISNEAALWATEFRHEGEDLQYYMSATGPIGKDRAGDVAAAERTDGLPVVALLLQPGSLADDPFILQSQNTGSEEMFSRDMLSADDLFGQPLSASEQEIKSKILATLPVPPTHKPPGPESMNNFSPDVESLYVSGTNGTGAVASSHGQAGLFGASDDQRRVWMEQWMDEWEGVLNRYTDEVWGNELPTVQEARQEIEEIRKDQGRLDDVQAVQRLKMILGHIRVPGVG